MEKLFNALNQLRTLPRKLTLNEQFQQNRMIRSLHTGLGERAGDVVDGKPTKQKSIFEQKLLEINNAISSSDYASKREQPNYNKVSNRFNNLLNDYHSLIGR